VFFSLALLISATRTRYDPPFLSVIVRCKRYKRVANGSILEDLEDLEDPPFASIPGSPDARLPHLTSLRNIYNGSPLAAWVKTGRFEKLVDKETAIWNTLRDKRYRAASW